VLPKWGKYGNAAVIHDWIYSNQECNREKADKILLEAMGVLSVPKWQRVSIYHAVRYFGWFAWIRNQWDREVGYSRIMKEDELKSISTSGRPGFIVQGLVHFRSRNKQK